MKTLEPLKSTSGQSSIQRPRFSAGLLLEDDDLNAGVDYTRGLMRLMLRSLFGCGVVCGLKVTAKWQCNDTELLVNVAPGLALDCMGDAINVPTAQALVLQLDCKPLPACVWVVVCHKEKCCRPRDVSCSDDAGSQPTYTRITDAFEVALYECLPKCACTCAMPDPERKSALDPCCDPPPPTVPTKASTTGTSTEDGKPEPCDCYAGHFNGDCECDCDCNCVVIGKIVLKEWSQDKHEYLDKLLEEPDYEHPEVVREVRPVLNGFLKAGCQKEYEKKNEKEKQREKEKAGRKK